jgi:hypothetical protein
MAFVAARKSRQDAAALPINLVDDSAIARKW